MSLINEMEKNSTIKNTKGGNYYATTFDSNLDLFANVSRFDDTDEIIKKFKSAYDENKNLALANLLFILDIREGKGERLVFKTIYKYLCKNYRDDALKIMPLIAELGRWDYVLVGLDTNIDNETVELIKNQLEEDRSSEKPSLMAKWLPSHKTHDQKNEIAKSLMKKLGMNEVTYRKSLSAIRKKLNLVETNLSEKNYDAIDFNEVPTKAMLKYNNVFTKNMKKEFEEYKSKVKLGEAKINTNGLYCYEIVKNIILRLPIDIDLYDLMWNNQKDILKENDKNVLIVADTSGSMMEYGCLPLANSIGLAIYFAERNKGIFHNHFITFSSEPQLQTIKGNTIFDKVKNMDCYYENTDVDKIFELILNSAKNGHIPESEMPSEIIMISDMEFDYSVYSQNGTNLSAWREMYKEAGYKMPQIIFWNVAGSNAGVPATKHEQDVMMISGFSTAILDKLLDLDSFTPIDGMMVKLEKYLKMLEVA